MWTPVLCVVVSLGLTGCPGGGSPTPTPPPRPAQPAQARPAAPAVVPAPVAAPARPTYVYAARGRRDPFRPLIEPRVRAVKTGPKIGLAALEVNEIKLAGIIWEQRGYLALVEAADGKGYVLRVNDTIGGDARVTKITPEGVTFEVKGATPLPQVRSRLVELRLRKEE
jgi:Tfp pilus assembly protein PilP